MSDDVDEGERLSFAHDFSFVPTAPSGGLGLGPLEIQYQELFALALEDGVITAEERKRLEKAAENLGINQERLGRLEDAMTVAYETHHRVRVVDQTLNHNHTLAPLKGAPPLPGLASAPPSVSAPKSAEVERLAEENTQLRQRIRDLEAELVRAQASINVEVDFGSFEHASDISESAEEIWKKVRRDPTDVPALRALKDAYYTANNADGSLQVCGALCALGAATDDETRLYEKHRPRGLIAPTRALDEKVWHDSLFHHEDDSVTGGLFAVVAPAILVGRVTTLRRDGMLRIPDAEQRKDPQTSTVMCVRALNWAAALMGLPCPRAYTDPAMQAGYVHTAGMPPYSVLGSQVLSGRDIPELAFLVGRHMTGYRGEHFVRTLFSGTEDLEDLFLAALLIANPKLPIKGAKRARVEPLALAIEPLLDAPSADRLRSAYLAFAEHGGRTNLQRWGAATEKTACRVGLALCQDLPTCLALLQEVEGKMGPLALDLLSYSAGGRFLALRQHLGISVGPVE